MDAQPAVKASVRRVVTRPRTPRRQVAVRDDSPSMPSPPLATEPGRPPICALPLPQQIADHLGHRIMTGECRPGSRLKEEEVARLYHVSRGPVREAFRILERRGFVEIVPRHGARVRAFDPADLASLFSVRAVLLGLAARQATEQASPELIGQLDERVARLRRSAQTMDISPREHALIAGEAQTLLARFSGNRPLMRMLEEMTGRALWRMAWRETPLDFTTRARRQQSAQFWSTLSQQVAAGDATAAERTGRALLEASRDHMLSAMAAQRGAAAADERRPGATATVAAPRVAPGRGGTSPRREIAREAPASPTLHPKPGGESGMRPAATYAGAEGD